MSTQRGTADAGFDTFAIAAMLAAERVRRGALRGRLRRQDGGLQIGALRLEGPEGASPELLPQWEEEELAESQSNRPFSPFISALGWTNISDVCVVDPDQAEAVERGAELIARLVEPAARSAWMAARRWCSRWKRSWTTAARRHSSRSRTGSSPRRRRRGRATRASTSRRAASRASPRWTSPRGPPCERSWAQVSRAARRAPSRPA